MTSTTTHHAAPRPLTTEALTQAAGGYTLICLIGKNNELICPTGSGTSSSGSK